MKESIAKAPSGRPTRKPVGYRDRLLTRNLDPNYVYRWVNKNMDQGDRVVLLEEAGYEKVPKGAHRVASGRVDNPSAIGSFEEVSGGSGDTLILMRQRKEYYEEDQKAKQQVVTERAVAMKKTPDGLYGKISEKLPTED